MSATGLSPISQEEALLRELDLLLPPAIPLDGPLPRVAVVVASNSQRRHLLRRLLCHRPAGWAGLRVLPLSAWVSELLARAGAPTSVADPAVEIAVRRLVEPDSTLGRSLDGLLDGAGALVGAVGDLLEAGFQPATDALPAAQLLAELPPSVEGADARLRAIDLLALAGRVRLWLDAHGLSLRPDRLRQAAALLRQRPELLGPETLRLHGLVDPSPAEAELLAALPVEARGPWTRSGDDGRGRGPGSPGSLRLVQTAGATALARFAARQCQEWIAEGLPAEELGIVVRDPGAWCSRLRVALDELGLPYSGVGALAPAGPAMRRVHALGRLLALRGDSPLETWIDALAVLPGASPRQVQELRPALAGQGLLRLRELAGVEAEDLLDGAAGLALPLRLPSAPAEDDDQALSAPRPPSRRRVSAALVRQAIAAARATLAALDPARRMGFRAWIQHLGAFLHTALGWADPDAAWRAWVSTAEGLAERLDLPLELELGEVSVVLLPALEGAARGPAGGEGGGVQLLSLTEARGRTFSALLVLGLNRGELPSSGETDPILGDPLRRSLRTLLPGLRLAEERRRVETDGLEALLQAAPRRVLGWAATDDDGRPRPPSPFVEAIRLRQPELRVEHLPAPGGLADGSLQRGGPPRPPHEHARLRALLGGADDAGLPALLSLCLADPRGAGQPAPLELAGYRLRVQGALDRPELAPAQDPFAGGVGPARRADDPRFVPLPVTAYEDIATCAWRAFLRRALHLEAPADPESAWVRLDPRWKGQIVHRVVEQVVRDSLQAAGLQGRAALDGATAEGPDGAASAGAPLRWPGPEARQRMTEQAAREVAEAEGLPLAGLWRVLALQAGPLVEVAHAMDQALGPLRVLGAELSGRVHVGGVDVSFRADRWQRGPDGRPCLVDLKTGRPISERRGAKGREAALFAQVERGERLQAALYALALGPDGRGAYLSLRAEGLAEDDEARFSVLPGPAIEWEAWRQAAEHAVAILGEAWRQGTLPPRLLDPKGDEPTICSSCELRLGCLQGDSAARLRQRRWLETSDPHDAATELARALLRLGRPAPQANDEEPSLEQEPA